MAGGTTTSRLVIVVPDQSITLVNNTFRAVDPSSVGDPIGVKLRRATYTTNQVVAWWGSWAMDDADRSEFMRAYGQAQWIPRPTAAEQTIYKPPTVPNFFKTDGTPAQRMFLFDGYLWTDPYVILRGFGLANLLDEE